MVFSCSTSIQDNDSNLDSIFIELNISGYLEGTIPAHLNYFAIIKNCIYRVLDKSYYLEMDLYKGNLFDFIENVNQPWEEIPVNKDENPNVNKAKIWNIIVELVTRLDMLHAIDIVHKDLKPENILMSTDDVPSIADFGVSEIKTLQIEILTK